jgi:hypothetical protein
MDTESDATGRNRIIPVRDDLCRSSSGSSSGSGRGRGRGRGGRCGSGCVEGHLSRRVTGVFPAPCSDVGVDS